MELNKQILHILVKEEIEKFINEETAADAANNLARYLANLMGKMQMNSPNQLEPIIGQAKQLLSQPDSAANKRKVQKDFDDIQSIDMSVDHDDGDHEGNMAKRQMFKTALYAAEIFFFLQEGENFWLFRKEKKENKIFLDC